MAIHNLAILALAVVFAFPCTLVGKADDYFPQFGSQGAVNGNLPQTGGAGGFVPQTGSIGAADPVEVVSKALLCFNNNYVYSSCEESYRLTESGNINVPPEYTDQYCRGSCFSETNLVLNCIDDILSHFLFYNRASVWDVRATIKAGCSYGPKRGNFNVAEHIQARENSGDKGSKHLLLGLLSIMIYIGT
ncbi:uncharacterized protein LOC141678693 [Apium graveolens]|uniref:uncharacterized protein LOC141678693 n=1 Tax=Apium graveolens TaxID=4045 RepID=UPI003D7909F4